MIEDIEQARQVLALQSYLDTHDELLKASTATYQRYVGDQIDDLPFQRALVDTALASERQWTAEIATGIGKTIISARVALERSHDGPVVYVCPNRTAVGDAATGIINKFIRTFDTFGGGRKLALGRVNELSRANDVSFVTPHALAGMLTNDARRTRELLKGASCMIIDEAHHFPEDVENDLKIYGAVYDAADQLVRDGLTVAMTGTWERLDGLRVMGRTRPDSVVTVQDAVDLGRCPEVYGVQVITDVVATRAQVRGDLYDLHLRPAERRRYLEGVAACMLATRRRYPVPFAGFVRTVADAQMVVNAYNARIRRGERPLAMLVSATSVVDRLSTIRAIEDGRLAGYVTCAVGEEALDLPKLEIVHLVRRTRSIVRNMQAVGRALRICEGKRRALVVDYQTMLVGVVDRFVGVGLENIVERQGSRVGKVVNGGPMVTQQGYRGATFEGLSVGEERVLVCRTQAPRASDAAKAQLLAMARAGAPRPRTANHRNQHTVPREEALLGRKLYNYTVEKRGTSYDAAFTKALMEVSPDWFDRHDATGKKETLLRMAREGAPKPKRRGPQHVLAIALYNYAYKASPAYDEMFVKALMTVRPEWGERMRFSTTQIKGHLRRLARGGKPRPEWTDPLGKALQRFKKTDTAFILEIKRVAPAWFERSSTTKKKILLERAKTGAPKPSFVDEPSLAHMLYKYTNPSKSFDATFTEELRALRPEWL